MSVVGIGTDLVGIGRMAALLDRHGERFLARCFRESEIDRPDIGRDRMPPADSVAARWAAKEAFLKALGLDVRDIPYRDIEVTRAETGPVGITLHGRAAMALSRAGGGRIHLTMSHEREFAVATVLIEG